MLAFLLFLSSLVPAFALLEPRQGIVDVQFPVSAYYQNYAAQGGNPRPSHGRLLLYLPANFDPARSFPVLVITSTTDGHRTSPKDAPMYRQTANAEGWVVLATDSSIAPRIDSTAWRLALLASGTDYLRHAWPAFRDSPVAFAGLSGGAKRSCWIGAMLSETRSIRIAGFFLAGINDDRMTAALQNYPATSQLLAAPVWISSGRNDPIAPPAYEREVQASFKHLGFRKVEFSQFYGGHEVDRADLRRALRWFRTIGNF